MKRIAILLALVLWSTGALRAQEAVGNVPHLLDAGELHPSLNADLEPKQWTMNVGVGVAAIQTIVADLYRPSVVPGGTTDWDRTIVPLNVNVNASCRVKRWLSFYFHLGVGYGTITCRNHSEEVLGVMHLVPVAFSTGIQPHYYTGRKVALYGLYGCSLQTTLRPMCYEPLGMGSMNTMLMFDMYPLCARFGGDRGVSFEMGFGSRGIFNLGYFWQF